MAERSYKSNLIQQKRSSCKKCMKAVFFRKKVVKESLRRFLGEEKEDCFTLGRVLWIIRKNRKEE